MSFPLDVTTQLLLNGVWTNAAVYQRDPITISRGRSDEASQVDPSRCNLTLDNRSGAYSPRNPSGPYFGALGRNTPLRILTPGAASNYVDLTGKYATYVTTPDVAALDITGDLDIRVDVEPLTWSPGHEYGLMQKWTPDNGTRSWQLFLRTDGKLQLNSSADGTAGISHVSTVVVPVTSARLALRATLDVDNGAAGHDVKFYTAPDIGGTWTQLGTTVTTAGTTSVFNSASPVTIGQYIFDLNLHGRVYAAEIRNGIAGTVVASPDFRAVETGILSFTDAPGRVWTLTGNAAIVNPNARFHGELSTLPPRWNQSGDDVYTPVQADGILRRLGQGVSALKSTMYRGLTTAGNVVAYWPYEDGSDATVLASALPGHPAMTINPTAGTAVSLSTYEGFKASEALPTGSGAIFASDVPDYPLSVPTNVQTRFLMHVPAAVPADGVALRVFTSGTAGRWDLKVNTGGSMSLITYDTDGNQINDSGAMGFAVNGKNLRVSLELSRVGADVTYKIVTLEVGQTSGSFFSGTVTGRSLGKATRVVVNSARFADVAYGHVSVHDEITSIFDLFSELNAWTGEYAADRILRLCAAEGIAVVLVGDDSDSKSLGAQLPKTLLELLREAADADLGILYEPRGFLGLAYRTRLSLYSQTAALALDYPSGDLASIEPVEDDQTTRNDVTVERVGGASARAELTTGALSTLPPPNGVGRYDEKIPVNVALDVVLPDQAGWRLHLGTVDEARYPVLGVNLASPALLGDPTATAAAQALDVGDRITVGNPPAWLPPDTIGQLAQGLTETLTRYQWEIAVNCSPASPWDVGIWGNPEILTLEQANFETSAGGWVGAGTPAPTVTQDASGGSHPKQGAGALKTVWNGSGTFPQAQLTLAGMTPNANYEFASWLYVPTGSPDVRLLAGTVTTALSAIKDTLHRLVLPFTPATSTPAIGIRSSGTPSGQAVWNDASSVRLAGGAADRYSSDGSSLAAGATSTATSLSVATPSGPLWSDLDGQFDIYVAGERMTVTAITGTTSPQTFTVIRSVNGVVKAQASAAEVRLFKPAIYAL